MQSLVSEVPVVTTTYVCSLTAPCTLYIGGSHLRVQFGKVEPLLSCDIHKYL